jgi:pyruvate/2-oxoglutarate dehydrogenase complex dihydrolipoamide acyltransferase (E2) component
VVYDAGNLYFDINTLGDSPVSYELKMKPVQRVKLSITFDASRVDEVQAVQFLSKLQNYLNEPESMLL